MKKLSLNLFLLYLIYHDANGMENYEQGNFPSINNARYSVEGMSGGGRTSKVDKGVLRANLLDRQSGVSRSPTNVKPHGGHPYPSNVKGVCGTNLYSSPPGLNLRPNTKDIKPAQGLDVNRCFIIISGLMETVELVKHRLSEIERFFQNVVNNAQLGRNHFTLWRRTIFEGGNKEYLRLKTELALPSVRPCYHIVKWVDILKITGTNQSPNEQDKRMLDEEFDKLNVLLVKLSQGLRAVEMKKFALKVGGLKVFKPNEKPYYSMTFK